MMVNARISFVSSFKTLLVALLFCFHTANAAVNGTSCYKCAYKSTMPANKQFCNATFQMCGPNETYCGVYSLKLSSNGTTIFRFGKGCYESDSCKNTTATCENAIVNGYLACSFVCCKGSGCNSAAVIVSPISSKMFIFGLIAVISFGILFV